MSGFDAYGLNYTYCPILSNADLCIGGDHPHWEPHLAHAAMKKVVGITNRSRIHKNCDPNQCDYIHGFTDAMARVRAALDPYVWSEG